MIVTFLSDYGLRDEYVGVCHGVIASRCPDVRIVDVAHGIPPGDVRAGALVLAGALPYMPAGVHLAVVDPTVGTRRRAVALRTVEQERLLVGPDNGLLMEAARRFGGAAEAVDVGESRERLDPVSRTFHGRDVFAPVAGALAAGAGLDSLGERIAVDGLHELEPSKAQVSAGRVLAHVLHVDGFGNAILDVAPEQLRAAEGETLHVGADRLAVRRAGTFADVAPGELLLYRDGRGMVVLAVNGGSAARRLDLHTGDEVVLE